MGYSISRHQAKAQFVTKIEKVKLKETLFLRKSPLKNWPWTSVLDTAKCFFWHPLSQNWLIVWGLWTKCGGWLSAIALKTWEVEHNLTRSAHPHGILEHQLKFTRLVLLWTLLSTLTIYVSLDFIKWVIEAIGNGNQHANRFQKSPS